MTTMAPETLQKLEELIVEYLHNEGPAEDGAHDLGHFRRVWKMCQRINALEANKGDLEVLLAASYFHDLVTFPKNHPDRKRSSTISAETAGRLLAERFPLFPGNKIKQVEHAIAAHSFSAGIPAETIEAKVLQDADRMEALGAIGIARTFYTAGLMHSAMFDGSDPLGNARMLDDNQFALDHFKVKLLRLPAQMQTDAGKQIAMERAAVLLTFQEQIVRELGGEL